MKKLQQEESGYDIKFIEDNKENILPLREGRKVSQLIQLYSKSAEVREAECEEQKRNFEHQLTIAQDKEVFEIFYNYINWTLTNYPEGQSFQSNLFHLLERACWKFCKDPDFKEDQRYFGFWAAYIKLTDNPVEIFALLDADKIGVCLSMRYEEEANYYEHKKQFQLALEAYQKGFKHHTIPVGALEKSFISFKERMSGLKGVHLKQLKIESPQLANSNAGTNQFDSTCLPPKSKGIAIFRDPEGLYDLDDESANTYISNYGPKDIRTKQNIISKTAWNALKIPQGIPTRPCPKKIIVRKDSPEPIQSKTKAVPSVSGSHLAISSKTGSNVYFIEKGSATPNIKFNIVASKELLNSGSGGEISFEEQRYASMNSEVNTKQSVNYVPLPNSKPNKKIFHQALHKKKPCTEPISASKPKASFPFTRSAKMLPDDRGKKLSGLPRCSTIYTENYSRARLGSSYLEEPEAARGEELDENSYASISGIGDKHLNTNSLQYFDDLSVPLITSDSPDCPTSPSMRLLLSYPTINTADTLELANALANEPIDYDLCGDSWVDPFASNIYDSSDEL